MPLDWHVKSVCLNHVACWDLQSSWNSLVPFDSFHVGSALLLLHVKYICIGFKIKPLEFWCLIYWATDLAKPDYSTKDFAFLIWRSIQLEILVFDLFPSRWWWIRLFFSLSAWFFAFLPFEKADQLLPMDILCFTSVRVSLTGTIVAGHKGVQGWFGIVV